VNRTLLTVLAVVWLAVGVAVLVHFVAVDLAYLHYAREWGQSSW